MQRNSLQIWLRVCRNYISLDAAAKRSIEELVNTINVMLDVREKPQEAREQPRRVAGKRRPAEDDADDIRGPHQHPNAGQQAAPQMEEDDDDVLIREAFESVRDPPPAVGSALTREAKVAIIKRYMQIHNNATPGQVKEILQKAERTQHEIRERLRGLDTMW